MAKDNQKREMIKQIKTTHRLFDGLVKEYLKIVWLFINKYELLGFHQ